MEFIGWLGAICFAFCALPQAIHAIRFKTANGVTWGLLVLWTLGEIFTLIYVLPKGYLPLIVNYVANLILLSIIIYYKVLDKKKANKTQGLSSSKI
jgi:uncharacterized protein with PQ loop repeat